MDNDLRYAVNMYVSKIKDYKNAADQKGIRLAVYVGGGQVSINGLLYDTELASDVSLRSGQVVYVALNQTGTKAVIIG